MLVMGLQDFSIETATPYVPIQAITARGFYATLPFRDGIDGAFGARLRRAAAP
jgi:16S rRNA (cytosine967-C5)-methyltransferase